MQKQRPKLKLYREEAKERLTTHWDLDYMTTAEIKEVMAARHNVANPGSSTDDTLGGVLDRLKELFTLSAWKRG